MDIATDLDMDLNMDLDMNIKWTWTLSQTWVIYRFLDLNMDMNKEFDRYRNMELDGESGTNLNRELGKAWT